MDFPMKNGWIFHSYVKVYQRVCQSGGNGSIKRSTFTVCELETHHVENFGNQRFLIGKHPPEISHAERILLQWMEVSLFGCDRYVTADVTASFFHWLWQKKGATRPAVPKDVSSSQFLRNSHGSGSCPYLKDPHLSDNDVWAVWGNYYCESIIEVWGYCSHS